MRRSTLDIVLDKACFFGLRGFEPQDLRSGVLPALPGGKTGILIEFNCKVLFERNAFVSGREFDDFLPSWKILPKDEGFEMPAENEKWINCYANISALKRSFSRLAILFPKEKAECVGELEKSCIAVFEKDDLREAGIEDLLRLKIAEMNVLQTPLFLSAKYAWLFALLLCALPFFIPSKPDEQATNLRHISSDVKKYSEKSDIAHVFKDGESIKQIARFAIGKYNSLVSTDNMINEYLKENDLSLESKIKIGDTIKLKLPAFDNPHRKAMQPAWNFFTGLLNDSLSYITELYNISEHSMRYHDGVDVAARMGTRILAPFSGTAITMEDERGGLIIAIAREKDVLIFMHCNQRFYLNGQTIMEGDPIASVGTSGHTTGPHVHVVAGQIASDGEKRIGSLRYKALDPFKWYAERDYSEEIKQP